MEPDLVVVGEADGVEAALELARDLEPDEVLLNLLMPGDGIEAARALREALPGVRIVVLTAHVTEQHVRALTELGVSGCLARTARVEEVVAALRSAQAGERYVQAAVARVLLLRPGMPSDRELDVLLLVAEGLAKAAIAGRLGIGESTVRYHLRNLFRKLGVRSRTEMLRQARKRRWIAY
jgi:two-component system response regulator DesR